MQRTKRYRYLAATLCGAMLLAAGCGDDDDAGGSAGTAAESDGSAPANTATQDSAADTPPTSGSTEGETAEQCTQADAGGDLTFGIRNEPVSFDPLTGATGSRGGSQLTAVFDTLMRYDPETGEITPHMAESLEPNDDHTEWTLTLRDDVTFASGNPVDTAAVKFTIDRHRADDSKSNSHAIASQIESIEIVDDTTMVFTLSSTWGGFPSLLAGHVGMVVDPAVFESVGAEGFAADPHGGGAGAFRFVRWSPGEEIVVEARDDYWDGPVCLDSVRFVSVDTDDALYESLRQGELDVAFLRDAATISQAREDDVDLHSQTSNGGFLLMINNGARDVDRPGSDLRVRKAIASSIDPELVDQRATGGHGIPSTALVPESSVLYSDAIEGTPYDPEQATALLDEAKADGYDGSLHFLCNNVYVDAALAIQGQLEAAGFDVELDNQMSIVDWLQRVRRSADFDITCHSLLMTDAQPWADLQPRFGADGSLVNVFGYRNADMADAMIALKEAVSVEERREAMGAIQGVWNETIPSLIYGHVEESVAWSDDVEGLEFTLTTTAMLDEVHLTR